MQCPHGVLVVDVFDRNVDCKKKKKMKTFWEMHVFSTGSALAFMQGLSQIDSQFVLAQRHHKHLATFFCIKSFVRDKQPGNKQQ